MVLNQVCNTLYDAEDFVKRKTEIFNTTIVYETLSNKVCKVDF
jgi:hypothetical protein